MPLYLISYDLNKPEKDYPKLLDYLKQIKAQRVLYSEWMLRTDTPEDDLHAALKNHIDANDGLMTCIVESAIGFNLKADIGMI